MTDPLIRIKRAVLDGRLIFTEKANLEMERDGSRRGMSKRR
jgi:hypothetical protein